MSRVKTLVMLIIVLIVALIISLVAYFSEPQQIIYTHTINIGNSKKFIDLFKCINLQTPPAYSCVGRTSYSFNESVALSYLDVVINKLTNVTKVQFVLVNQLVNSTKISYQGFHLTTQNPVVYLDKIRGMPFTTLSIRQI